MDKANPSHSDKPSSLEVRLSAPRVVMRGPMFPNLVRFADGSIVLGATSQEEHSAAVSIRSTDGGATWRPWAPGLPTHATHAVTQLPSGRAFASSFELTPTRQPGQFASTYWESTDCWRTVRGPALGTVHLPVGRFDPQRLQRFYGNIVVMPDGELLASLQGRGPDNLFRCFLCCSGDGGRAWHFVSFIASLETIDDPHGKTRSGWKVYGPCEANLLRLGGERLLCVMRLVNDDEAPLLGAASDTYADLNCAIAGSDFYPGTVLPGDKFIGLGPASVPLIAAWSEDRGRTWSRALPIAPGCGCFPRMVNLADKASPALIALAYGAIRFPRWGNCIGFSLDDGRTWIEEINFGPYLTTGYADLIATGPGRFLCTFDCAAPQPWKNHAAHWVGIVDGQVEAGY